MAAIIAAFFTFQYEPNFFQRGWSCLRVGTPIALLSVIPFWLLLRRGALLSPTLTWTATGLLAGLVGTSVLEVHCPNFDAWHRLVSHLGVAVIGTLTGLVSCPDHNVIASDPSDNHETETGGAGDHGRTTERAEHVGGIAHITCG
jgi:hypothetical protein